MTDDRLLAMMDAIGADYAAIDGDLQPVDLLAELLDLEPEQIVSLVEVVADVMAESDESVGYAMTFAMLTGANLALKFERAAALKREIGP